MTRTFDFNHKTFYISLQDNNIRIFVFMSCLNRILRNNLSSKFFPTKKNHAIAYCIFILFFQNIIVNACFQFKTYFIPYITHHILYF